MTVALAMRERASASEPAERSERRSGERATLSGSPRGDAPRKLLVPQRRQWIRACRTPGWNQRREKHAAEDDGQCARERRGVGCGDPEERALQEPGEHKRRHHADARADRPEPKAAREKPADDGAP